MTDISNGTIKATDIAGSTGWTSIFERDGIIALRRLADRNADGETTLSEAESYIKDAKQVVLNRPIRDSEKTQIDTFVASEILRHEVKKLFKEKGLDYDKSTSTPQDLQYVVDGAFDLYDIDVPEHVSIKSFRTNDYRLGTGISHKIDDGKLINQNSSEFKGKSIVDLVK